MPTNISSDIPSGYRRLADSERQAMPGARILGEADPSEEMTVTILVRRRYLAEPVAQTGVKISRADFTEKFASSEQDIQRVIDFAENNGLDVLESHTDRRTVVVAGTVEAMNRAFIVQLQTIDSPDQGVFRGREGFVHVPDELAEIIEGVFGLDNRKIGGRNSVATPERDIAGMNLRKPSRTDGGYNTGDPPNTKVLTVPQVAQLYQFPSNSASGQTIGILEMGGGAICRPTYRNSSARRVWRRRL